MRAPVLTGRAALRNKVETPESGQAEQPGGGGVLILQGAWAPRIPLGFILGPRPEDRTCSLKEHRQELCRNRARAGAHTAGVSAPVRAAVPWALGCTWGVPGPWALRLFVCKQPGHPA